MICHHQAPLARVLADLRAAEKRAKGKGERDAFSITLSKRAGGATHLVGKWRLTAGMNGDMGLLLDLRDMLSGPLSRRAAYLIAETLRDLPPSRDALAAALAYHFKRQGNDENAASLQLAVRLASAAVEHYKGYTDEEKMPEWPGPNRWLRDVLITAEFLAREGRVEIRPETKRAAAQ